MVDPLMTLIHHSPLSLCVVFHLIHQLGSAFVHGVNEPIEVFGDLLDDVGFVCVDFVDKILDKGGGPAQTGHLFGSL